MIPPRRHAHRRALSVALGPRDCNNALTDRRSQPLRLGTTRRARGHFGFDRPWWDAANELGLELTAALGPGGWTTAPPFRPAPHVSTRRQAGTSSWSNGTLEARPAQSERSPIPAPRDLHAIRPAAHHTVSIGAALRRCALYTYEFLFGRSTNQRIYRTCGMADVFWAARTPMACRPVTAVTRPVTVVLQCAAERRVHACRRW